MNISRLSIPICVSVVCSCGVGPSSNSVQQPCSEQWFQHVEEMLQTGDAEGLGPDLGSSEWRSVIEFKLGIRGDPSNPQRDTDEWCSYIDDMVHK